MPWVWDQRSNILHDLAHLQPKCGLDGLPSDKAKTYDDEITATTVLKTRHLIPCRWCYRPRGRFGSPPGEPASSPP